MRRASQLGFDSDAILFDLCSQLTLITSGLPLHESVAPDLQMCKELMNRLQRHANRSQKIFYFVLDGLFDVSDSDADFRDTIVEVLPIGAPRMRFLISSKDIQSSPRAKVRAVTLTPFSLEETTRVMHDVVTDPDELRLAHQITSAGNPSQLADLRRMILAGRQTGDILNDTSVKTSYYGFAWRSSAAGGKDVQRFLAVLAFDERPLTISDMSRIIETSETDVSRIAESCNFVRFDSVGLLEFSSSHYKGYVRDKLAALRVETNRVILADLYMEPTNKEALIQIPDLLQRLGEFEALISYLSPENFDAMVEKLSALGPVRVKAKQGVEAASRSERAAALLQFAMQRSIFLATDSAEVWRAEIQARVALGQLEAARSIAHCSALREERLLILAAVAKAVRARGDEPPADLIDEIRRAHAQVDFQSGAIDVLAIAAELVYSTPQLAMDTLEQAEPLANGENSLDWAYAAISLHALSAEIEVKQSREAFDTLQSRIKDPVR